MKRFSGNAKQCRVKRRSYQRASQALNKMMNIWGGTVGKWMKQVHDEGTIEYDKIFRVVD
jgi:hypothetical protein